MKRTDSKEDIYAFIYEVVRKIPKGRVSTYGAIAEAVGLTSGARLVGYAMNHCKNVKPKVPAHRVVNSAGLLTGKHHFATPTLMQELLEKEGVIVKDEKVAEFEKKFWRPLKEMEI